MSYESQHNKLVWSGYAMVPTLMRPSLTLQSVEVKYSFHLHLIVLTAVTTSIKENWFDPARTIHGAEVRTTSARSISKEKDKKA